MAGKACYANDVRDTKAYCEGRTLAAGGGTNTMATGTTGVEGSDTGLTWTSSIPGDGVVVRLVDPGGADEALAITESGSTVTVSLATDAQEAIVTTAAEIIAEAGGELVLVSVDDTGDSDGSGVVEAETVVLSGSAYPCPPNSPDGVAFSEGFISWTADPDGVAQDCCADAYGGGFGE